MVWISGRSVHPKNSPEAIEQFKKLFPEEVEAIRDKLDTDKVEVWWQDECRVGQQGSLSRCWASKGTRPRVVSFFRPIFSGRSVRIGMWDAPGCCPSATRE